MFDVRARVNDLLGLPQNDRCQMPGAHYQIEEIIGRLQWIRLAQISGFHVALDESRGVLAPRSWPE